MDLTCKTCAKKTDKCAISFLPKVPKCGVIFNVKGGGYEPDHKYCSNFVWSRDIHKPSGQFFFLHFFEKILDRFLDRFFFAQIFWRDFLDRYFDRFLTFF